MHTAFRIAESGQKHPFSSESAGGFINLGQSIPPILLGLPSCYHILGQPVEMRRS